MNGISIFNLGGKLLPNRFLYHAIFLSAENDKFCDTQINISNVEEQFELDKREATKKRK